MEELMALQRNMQSTCRECVGLCCRALYFSKIDGFCEDKKANVDCRYLSINHDCSIYEELIQRNYYGCIQYDCFNAGPFAKQRYDEIEDPTNNTQALFDVFFIMFQLFQIRYYLIEATKHLEDELMKKALYIAIQENIQLCNEDIQILLNLNVEQYRKQNNDLLKKASMQLLNNHHPRNPKNMNKSYENQDISNMDFNMKMLIQVNFKKALCNHTQFLGSDMRDADLSDANLEQAIFLTQAQINSAKGNQNTKIPSHLIRPRQWK